MKLSAVLTLSLVLLLQACSKGNEQGTTQSGGSQSGGSTPAPQPDPADCPAQPVSYNGLAVYRDVKDNHLLYMLDAHANWDAGGPHGEICLSKRNKDIFLIYSEKHSKKIKFSTKDNGNTAGSGCPSHPVNDPQDYGSVVWFGDYSATPPNCRYQVTITDESVSYGDPHIKVGT